MRRPLRSAFVVRLLSALFAGYLHLVYRTLRWTTEGGEKAEAVWKEGEG